MRPMGGSETEDDGRQTTDDRRRTTDDRRQRRQRRAGRGGPAYTRYDNYDGISRRFESASERMTEFVCSMWLPEDSPRARRVILMPKGASSRVM